MPPTSTSPSSPSRCASSSRSQRCQPARASSASSRSRASRCATPEDPGQSGRLLRADPGRLDHQDGGVAPRKLVGGREPADPGADDDRVPSQARSFSRPGRFHGVIAVLDDDPTGSQTVYGATVVTALDEVARRPAHLLPDQHTVAGRGRGRELTYDVARRLFESDPDVEIVSRSDSTLRGHVLAEVQAIDRARRDVLGAGYDGVLLAPRSSRPGASRAATCTTRASSPWARPSSRRTPRSGTRPRTSSTSWPRRAAAKRSA